MNQPDYNPSKESIRNSNLYHYMDWLKGKFDLEFQDYDVLWQWSVDHSDLFWNSLLEYFEISYTGQFLKIRSQEEMPGVQWFEGLYLNYGYHLTRGKPNNQIALIACDEAGKKNEMTWENVLNQASKLQCIFNELQLLRGDRVVAYLPNIPEASIGLIASVASGLVWSSCSPDYGSASVIDRFLQIEPKVLIAVDHYQYGGKSFDRRNELKEIIHALPSLKAVILVRADQIIPYHDLSVAVRSWENSMQEIGDLELKYVPVPFNHPIWILYSSGTTGLPKAITHSHGGMLMEHLKYIHFHNNVKSNERFFWYTTTGWMMWNYLHATWLMGAVIVLYDGHPAYPDTRHLWDLANDLGIDHFGTSAPFLHASIKEKISIQFLPRLKSISSTGSPLNNDVYPWLYEQIKHDFYLWSMSGGTDMCTAFVGGCAIKPIYFGEIQCRALGCDLQVLDEEGNAVKETVGELVIQQPMPCMPIYFWNDPNMEKYKESYFRHYPGKWRHGDWITLTEHLGLVISGRSDTTLKRFGVRIGTAEIYAALLHEPKIDDALIIHYDDEHGNSFMPLFVKLKTGTKLDEPLQSEIKHLIRLKCSPRHLPDQIFQVRDIPYTWSGKKMEAPIKKIFQGKSTNEVAAKGAMKNPDCLNEYYMLASEFRLRK